LASDKPTYDSQHKEDQSIDMFLVGSKVKILMDAPEQVKPTFAAFVAPPPPYAHVMHAFQIWGFMEADQYLEASRAFLIAKATYTELEQSASDSPLDNFPFLRQQWVQFRFCGSQHRLRL
jgi:hypothetical protein